MTREELFALSPEQLRDAFESASKLDRALWEAWLNSQVGTDARLPSLADDLSALELESVEEQLAETERLEELRQHTRANFRLELSEDMSPEVRRARQTALRGKRANMKRRIRRHYRTFMLFTPEEVSKKTGDNVAFVKAFLEYEAALKVDIVASQGKYMLIDDFG